MRKRGLIAVLAAMMVMASAAACFADDGEFKLEKSFPTDGQTNTSIDNLSVKLYFNKALIDNEPAKAVKLVDAEGNKVPIDLYVSTTEEGMILVVADTTSDYKALNNSKYTLVINEGFAAADGSTLSEPVQISFTTINQKMMTTVNMVMMFVMMGVIMVISVKQQKDKIGGDKKDKNLEPQQFNPYKEAKRTGKTIEEVTEEHEKAEAKLAKKRAKKSKSEPEYVKNIICADYLTNVYKVKAPAPSHKKNIAEPAAKAKTPAKKGKKK